MNRALLVLLLLPAAARADDPVEFNRDVRPILADTCFKCHGLDAKARRGKLRLDVPEDAYKEHASGLPIKPGDPKASAVWERVTSTDPDVMMPPPESEERRGGSG